CNKSCDLLAEQIAEFEPAYALACNDGAAQNLHQKNISGKTRIINGSNELANLAKLPEADIILNAIVGFAGFESTVKALENDKMVALANKESLVVGGALIQDILDEGDGTLIPVDSEHSAIFQCLVGEQHKTVEKLIITASG